MSDSPAEHPAAGRHPEAHPSAAASGEKRTLPELEEFDRSYRALFDSLTEHVVVLGLDGRILGINQAALRAHGYQREEVVGQQSIILADEERADLDSFKRAFATAAAGTPTHIFLWARRSNGDTFPAELSFTSGRYFGQDAVIALGRDISERYAAEQQRSAAEAHYRRIVDTTPSAIFAVDRDGVLQELNPGGQRILERDAEQLIGRHFRELLPPEDQVRGIPPLEAVLRGELETAEYETRIRRPSGEVRHLHAHLAAIVENGAVRGAHGIARDITEELKKEQHLRRVERLATIGTLIGGVAHELNNPLQAIGSFASLLLEEDRPERERRDLETIRREAARASRVVSDLRMLARDSQEAIGKREQVDPNEVVRHVLRTREYKHRTHNIEVRADLGRGLPALWADPGGLEQVLINLIVNAEQAMAGQETPRVLIVRTRSTGDGVALHVVDSGPGITQQHLNRIFDPFFTTKERSEGTGLGLSLVHKIIREHAGQIQVESEPGRGAAFHIHLPRLATTLPDEEPVQTEAPIPWRALHVLVVDDEPALRTVLSRYLDRRGHTVAAATDGADALRRIRDAEKPFDIILSDLRMPGLGGDELLAVLRAQEPTAHHKIMFLTGEPPNGGMAAAIDAAEVPIIYKPIELAELAAQVERHAARPGAS